jgi:hypothetical protein
MTVAALLKTALTNISGISSLVGTRAHPIFLPQSPTLPAISYQRISSTGQNGTSERKQSRWQINCWASTHVGVTALAAAVKAGLEEYHDADQTPAIDYVRVVGELDDFDDTVKTYRIIIDVMLHTTGD